MSSRATDSDLPLVELNERLSMAGPHGTPLAHKFPADFRVNVPGRPGATMRKHRIGRNEGRCFYMICKLVTCTFFFKEIFFYIIHTCVCVVERAARPISNLRLPVGIVLLFLPPNPEYQKQAARSRSE